MKSFLRRGLITFVLSAFTSTLALSQPQPGDTVGTYLDGKPRIYVGTTVPDDFRPTIPDLILTVNSLWDEHDDNHGDGICSNGFLLPDQSGWECTLRAAIDEANAQPAGSIILIDFNVLVTPDVTQTDSVNGLWIVKPGSTPGGPTAGLPSITHANVTIDGTRNTFDPGGPNEHIPYCGELWNGIPHELVVVLDGSGQAGRGGLEGYFDSDGFHLRGLVIYNFANSPGVVVLNNSTLECLYVGTTFDGAAAGTEMSSGIFADAGPSSTATLTVFNSLVSGNEYGIWIEPTWVDSDISGNIIGLNATATSAIPNDVGIHDNALRTRIGSWDGGLGNVIAGNTEGIRLFMSEDVRIGGNFIGLNQAGTPLPNGIGVKADNYTLGAQIGGPIADMPNVISYNTHSGVEITGSISPAQQVTVSRNRIFANGGLGIELKNEDGTDTGPHVIDDGDADTGPNGFQNQPEIFAVVANAPVPGQSTIAYGLRSTPSTSFVIQFYQSTSPDPSGYGEGQSFLGEKLVTTNASGFYNETWMTPAVTVDAGKWVTATATPFVLGEALSTSEFSNARQAGPFILEATLLLEGPYFGTGVMSTGFDYATSLPTLQPYNHSRYDGTLLDYDGNEQVFEWPLRTIDWIVLSLRDLLTAEIPGSRRVALLRDDGVVMDLDGSTRIAFPGVSSGAYYVVACHANHLCVMSDTLVGMSSGVGRHDFTSGAAYTPGPPAQKVLHDGRRGLFAGNGIPDATIQTADIDEYLLHSLAGATLYQWADFNLDGAVQSLDYNLCIGNAAAAAWSRVP